jgi:N-acetylglucosaminyl-diphospho-decaprenol L-rhamnosyltransferase
MIEVDAVIVSYKSSATLRSCVEPLSAAHDVNVIVVDSASQDNTLASIADLAVTLVALDVNRGFAYGCNRGWRVGEAPAVLFLNPDARIDPDSIRRLKEVLDQDPTVGLVAPRITDDSGSLEFSIRRFPRLRSTYARAFFLHRLFPNASWSDEVTRERSTYDSPHSVEWVSGACMLVRRSALQQLGGWDEGFFLYGEDVDLCRRLWTAGYDIRYEPSAHVGHRGGGSAPRASLLPTLAASRIKYARLHFGRGTALLEEIGVAVGELTHAALTTKGAQARSGHLRAVLACMRPAAELRPSARPTSANVEPWNGN